MQGDDEILPTRLSPGLKTLAVVQHRVCESNELVESAHNTVRKVWIVLDHLNRTKEERITAPEVPRFSRVYLRPKPTRLVLMIEDIIEELLHLGLDCRVVDEDTIGNQTVLLETMTSLVIDLRSRTTNTHKPVTPG